MASFPCPPLGQVPGLRREHRSSVHKLTVCSLFSRVGLEVEPKAACAASTGLPTEPWATHTLLGFINKPGLQDPLEKFFVGRSSPVLPMRWRGHSWALTGEVI